MYYSIIGDIQFTQDEEWKDEASIERVYATLVSLTAEEAEERGEWLADILGGKDWLVPQLFQGRIYNKTDKEVVLTDSFITSPHSKVEWAQYQQHWAEQQRPIVTFHADVENEEFDIVLPYRTST